MGHKFSNGRKVGHCVNAYALYFVPICKSDVRKYIGVLPYTFDPHGQLWFLLGKEKNVPTWPASNTWSCFGGAQEVKEDKGGNTYGEMHCVAAARELDEEISGFFGCRTHLEEVLKTCPIFHSPDGKVTEFLLSIDWETYKMLPLFFNRNHTALLACAVPNPENKSLELPGCPKGYFEFG